MKSRSAQNAPASPCTVIAAPGCTDGIAAAVVKAGNRSVPEKKRGVLHAVYYGSGEVQNPPHQIRLPRARCKIRRTKSGCQPFRLRARLRHTRTENVSIGGGGAARRGLTVSAGGVGEGAPAPG